MKYCVCFVHAQEPYNITFIEAIVFGENQEYLDGLRKNHYHNKK